jgi:hypothetical protein
LRNEAPCRRTVLDPRKVRTFVSIHSIQLHNIYLPLFQRSNNGCVVTTARFPSLFQAIHENI